MIILRESNRSISVISRGRDHLSKVSEVEFLNMSKSASSRIIATGMTSLIRSGESATVLKQRALENALKSMTNLRSDQLDGLISVPSLAEGRFMDAHYLATHMSLLPNKSNRGMTVKTIDTGGASPITALLEADNMIKNQGYSLVAIVAGDAVASMPTEEFLRRANEGCADPIRNVEGPVIPLGYNNIAQWQLARGTVTRNQLAMVSVLMSRQAVKHPYALTRKPHSLDTVLQSPLIASVTTLLECARRADGAAAVIVASPQFIRDNLAVFSDSIWDSPIILGGGEASGPLYPPEDITEEMFSCGRAAKKAYEAASVSVSDIDYFSIYDCFPICFIKGVEAVGLAEKGAGGKWVEDHYRKSEMQGGILSPSDFPVNTHGGLLAFGAPWEAPAMYGLVEAVMQLTDLNKNQNQIQDSDSGPSVSRDADRLRQVPHAKRALVYGNGGIFSASAVAILEKGTGRDEAS